MPDRKRLLERNSPEFAVVIFAILGFIFSVRSTSQLSENGVVTSCSSTDIGAAIFGVATLLAAAACANFYRNRNNLRWGDGRKRSRIDRWTLVVAAVGAAVGLLHLLRGAGVIFGPCN